jgi:hypothetical protein
MTQPIRTYHQKHWTIKNFHRDTSVWGHPRGTGSGSGRVTHHTSSRVHQNTHRTKQIQYISSIHNTIHREPFCHPFTVFLPISSYRYRTTNRERDSAGEPPGRGRYMGGHRAKLAGATTQSDYYIPPSLRSVGNRSNPMSIHTLR